jgi:putative sugar O-methyltransferase
MNNKDQLDDDNVLLDTMIVEMLSKDKLYTPTNYWERINNQFLPELKKIGLKDFRKREHSAIGSFAANDLKLKGEIKLKKEFFGLHKLVRILNNYFSKSKILSLTTNDWGWASTNEITEYFYFYVKEKFQKINIDIQRCSTSKLGNPEDLIEIENKFWSTQHLIYCSMFADAYRYIPFKNESVYCELGSGLGRSIEILGNLYPDMTILTFDIPPQLYLCNQYLKKIFKERVIPYEKSIYLSKNKLDDEIKGKIIILPSWKVPERSELKINIFWNSASFQEMEPMVVNNYLNFVKKMDPDWIYINAMPGGNYWGEWKKGRGGTKEPVTEEIYIDNLKCKYKLSFNYFTDYFLRKREYKSYIFEHIYNGNSAK